MTATAQAASAQKNYDYTVRAGDTIGSIAAKFGTTEQTVREMNFLLNDDIFPGQVLHVPFVEGISVEGMPTPTPMPFQYTVEAGDSLGSIAIQFGVTTVALIEANGIEDPNSLTVGSELLIPGYQPPVAAGQTEDTAATGAGGAESSSAAAGASANGQVYHVIQPGESLNSIAADYNIDPAALAEANSITNRNMIRVGQKLLIPGITQRQAIEARGTRHVVQSGESLSAIAQKYNVTMEQIMALNAIDDPNTIFVGQELLVPEP